MIDKSGKSVDKKSDKIYDTIHFVYLDRYLR